MTQFVRCGDVGNDNDGNNDDDDNDDNDDNNWRGPSPVPSVDHHELRIKLTTLALVTML